MSFASLGDLLPQSLRQADVVQRLNAAKVVEVAGSVAGRLFPPAQMRFIHPVSFVEGTLRVAITAPAAAHAIRLKGGQWITDVNKALGVKKVQKIAVKRQGF